MDHETWWQKATSNATFKRFNTSQRVLSKAWSKEAWHARDKEIMELEAQAINAKNEIIKLKKLVMDFRYKGE